MPWSTSVVVSAMEKVWAELRKLHPDLPEMVVIVGPGRLGKLAVWGYYAPLRWRVGDDSRDEILIAGELFERGPVPVLGVILHEAAHALANKLKIKDTSRGGRYHNLEFKKLAETFGLVVNKDRRYGWTDDHLPVEVATERYPELVKILAPACAGHRTGLGHAKTPGESSGDEGKGEDGEKKSGTRVKVVCKCDPVRSFRISPKVLETGAIRCTVCDAEFSAADEAAG